MAVPDSNADASPSSTILVRHGTTFDRGQSIIEYGPNGRFQEPGSSQPSGGFSVAGANQKLFPLGSPEQYAVAKSRLFPDEGGPVIVEFEIPQVVAQLATIQVMDDPLSCMESWGELCFEPGCGLEALQAIWPELSKRLVRLDQPG